VLYEMLTGKRAFDGDDVSETLAAILRAVPDWNALPAAAPLATRKLLARCLQKERRERLADIADARLEIVDAQREAVGQEEPATVTRPRSNVRIHLTWVAAAALVALAVGLASTRLRPVAPPARSIRFEIQPPQGWAKPFDNRPATGTASASISPDGAHVAFLARNDGGQTTLWIRTLNQLISRQLAGTQGALGPFWSPDSRYIAFFADDKLKKVEISGSAPQTLCEALHGATSGTWGRDGVIVFSDIGSRVETNGLKQVPATGGVPRSATVLQPGEAAHLRPAFLPDGRHFLYRAANATTSGNTWIGSLDLSDRTLLFENTSTGNVTYADGRLLFMRGTTLVAQHFDTTSLKLSGTPVPIAEQVETNALNPPVGAFSVSENGTLVYRMSPVTLGGQLTLLDRAGTVLTTSGARGDYSDVELSPDGKHAAIAVRDPDAAARDIWIADIERGIRDRFTFNPAAGMRSAWSPDGSQLAFSRDQGRMDVFIKPANGNTPVEQPLLANDDFNRSFERVPLSWSPDGIILLEVGARFGSTSTHTELWMVRTTGDRKAVPFLQRPFNVSQGRFSPDGHWVAYVSEETGQPNVYITPFPGPGNQSRVSVDGGTQPRWSSNGHELVFIHPGELQSVAVHFPSDGVSVGRASRLFPVAVQNAPFLSSYDVSRDGQRFLVNMLNTNAQQTASPIAVVLNWTAGLP
jgi:Tol biopolymer transport system component